MEGRPYVSILIIMYFCYFRPVGPGSVTLLSRPSHIVTLPNVQENRKMHFRRWIICMLAWNLRALDESKAYLIILNSSQDLPCFRTVVHVNLDSLPQMGEPSHRDITIHCPTCREAM